MKRTKYFSNRKKLYNRKIKDLNWSLKSSKSCGCANIKQSMELKLFLAVWLKLRVKIVRFNWLYPKKCFTIPFPTPVPMHADWWDGAWGPPITNVTPLYHTILWLRGPPHPPTHTHHQIEENMPEKALHKTKYD